MSNLAFMPDTNTFLNQLQEADDPVQAMLEDFQRAHAAGDKVGATRILTQIIESFRTEMPLSFVNASKWLLENMPEADQILEDTFDAGDKVAIIGASKLKKSFFLQQGVICLAAGLPFLNWNTPKQRRVVLIQFEVQQGHFHKRLKRECRALNVSPSDLGDRLHILNARGLGLSGPEGIERIKQAVSDFKPEVIALDPLYKISNGVENAAEDMKAILNSFDELAEQTGAAILYTHHDAKGNSGDRDIRDRGAGSNVLSRDYDCCLTLTAHATNEEATVVDVLLRNYRPQSPFAIRWIEDNGNYRFDTAPDVVPEKKTSRSKKAEPPPYSTYLPIAEQILENGEIELRTFKDEFRVLSGLSFYRMSCFLAWATSGGRPPLITREERGKGKHKKFIDRTGHDS